MTQVPPPKKIEKEKEVKKQMEGKTEEKKNKEDDHSTRKLEGSATYLFIYLFIYSLFNVDYITIKN